MDKAFSLQLCTRLSKVRRVYLSLLCLCSDEGMAVCHVFTFYAHGPKSIATTRVIVLCVYGEHVCGDLRVGKSTPSCTTTSTHPDLTTGLCESGGSVFGSSHERFLTILQCSRVEGVGKFTGVGELGCLSRCFRPSFFPNHLLFSTLSCAERYNPTCLTSGL